MSIAGIKIVVEAIDRATAPMRRIGAAIRGIDLAPLRNQLRSITNAVRSVGAELGRLTAGAAAGLAAAATGIAAAMMSVSGAAKEARLSSERLGISLESFQGLAHAAGRAGLQSDEMRDALSDLSEKVYEAGAGNEDLQKAFKRLGVSLRDAHGQLRPVDAILADMADGFQRMPSGAEKTALAIMLMGDAGGGLIPILNKGSAGLRQAREEAERLGLVIDERAASAFADFDRNIAQVTGAFTGLRNVIAIKLLPVIAPMVARVTEWVVANRELVASRITEWVEALPGAIEKATAAFTAWADALAPVGRALGSVVDMIGPWNAGLGLAATIIGGKLVLGVANLVLGLGGLAVALGKLAFGPVIAAIGGFVTAIRGGATAMAAFNAVLMANPIGLAIVGIGLLAAGAYLVYTNWDGIAAWFKAMWDDIQVRLDAFVAWLDESFVQPVKDLFKQAADLAKPYIASIAGAIDRITASINGAVTAWGVLTEMFNGGFKGPLTPKELATPDAPVSSGDYRSGDAPPAKRQRGGLRDGLLYGGEASPAPSGSGSRNPHAEGERLSTLFGPTRTAARDSAPDLPLVFGPGNSLAGSGARRQGETLNVGGRVEIAVKVDGPATTRVASTSYDPRVSFEDVGAGLSNATPA